MDRFAQMIVAAAHQARADAGLEVEQECDRVGVSVATAMGGLKSFEDACETLIERGPGRVSPFAIPAIIPNMGAAQISIELGTKGPLTSQCTACAASTMAIGDGLDAIRLGRADVMLAGGSEAPITRVGIAGFSAMRALSQRNDDPEHASRPFEADRDGFVMGEAGAVLVLEELGHATRRDARIYAELAGYGVSSDAQHLTEPDPTGQSPARAMRMAFADAGISPEQIDYINAHGTSTPLGDASETRVIKRALGEHIARRVPVSSTKGATGHASALPVRSRRSSARSRSTKGCCRRPSTTRRPIPSAISTTSRTKHAKPTLASPSQTRPASAGTTHRLCCAGSRDRHQGSWTPRTELRRGNLLRATNSNFERRRGRWRCRSGDRLRARDHPPGRSSRLARHPPSREVRGGRPARGPPLLGETPLVPRTYAGTTPHRRSHARTFPRWMTRSRSPEETGRIRAPRERLGGREAPRSSGFGASTDRSFRNRIHADTCLGCVQRLGIRAVER